ncbi:MAG: ribosomal protein S18-alanine N-acetyltransferase [Myxococcota bacterium]
MIRRAVPADLRALCLLEQRVQSHPWTMHALEPEFSNARALFFVVVPQQPQAYLDAFSRRQNRQEALEEQHLLYLESQYTPSQDVEATMLLGYCLLWRIQPELHVINLAVAPEVRRRGIAREMMVFAIGQARTLGCTEVLLEVRASNHSAIRLYESFDFERVGLRKDYYEQPCEDALLYTLALGGAV